MSRITTSQRSSPSICRPIVEEANRGAPAYSRIFKELILVTRPDKPLPRTEKGTVMRKLALRAYNDEIEKMYVMSRGVFVRAR